MEGFSASQLHEALELLGAVLEETRAPKVSLVVAGGSALMAQGLITRHTHDVDVIALQAGDLSAYPLPESLELAAARVAQELGLKPNWLNNAVTCFIGRDQLPEWIWWGLHSRIYGACLTVGFIGRGGLILLKLWAALERNEPRDLADLSALAPSAEETERHLRWVLAEILGNPAHPKLATVLTHLRHGSLLDRFRPPTS